MPNTQAPATTPAPIVFTAQEFVRIWAGDYKGVKKEDGKGYWEFSKYTGKEPLIIFENIKVKGMILITESKNLPDIDLKNSTTDGFAIIDSIIGKFSISHSTVKRFRIINSTIGDVEIINSTTENFEIENSKTGSFSIKDSSITGDYVITNDSTVNGFGIYSSSKTGNFDIKNNSKVGDFWILYNAKAGNFNIKENSKIGDLRVRKESVIGDFLITGNSKKVDFKTRSSPEKETLGIYFDSFVGNIEIHNSLTGNFHADNAIINDFLISDWSFTGTIKIEDSTIKGDFNIKDKSWI